jgi:hypothetical protein
MKIIRYAVAAGLAALVLASCGAKAASSHPVSTNLSQVGLVCIVNMPGEVGSGESITITANNTRPAAHVFLQSVQVGGYEGLSGNYAGPDTVTVNRWINLAPGQSKTYGPFPISDPALENVGNVGGICINGSAVIGSR